MDVLYPRCAGLDIHKKVIVACRIVPGERPTGQRVLRTFGTTTAAIEELGDWLAEEAVTHVAMEATGVYWQPIYNLLEERFTLVLANAQHIKQVPGRKTDVKDAEWIADLLRHGLIRGSFVPQRAQRELRELTRYRVTLVRERAAVANRLQKTLEGANIKLGDVASDVLGVSGRAMLERLIAGETNPVVLADEARQQLRAKRPALEAALRGSVGAHQRFLLRQEVTHIDQLTDQIGAVSVEIERRLREPTPSPIEGAPALGAAPEASEPPSPPPPPESPGAAAVARLDTIPGVGRRVAEVLVAEIGLDMGRFPSGAHLASWAGLCPGHHESAGKQRSGRTRKGNPTLRATLIEAARAAARTQTALAERFRRLAARRGSKRAAIGVAHAILVIAYQLLRDGTVYVDARSQADAEPLRERTTRHLVQRLQALGLSVQVSPSTA